MAHHGWCFFCFVHCYCDCRYCCFRLLFYCCCCYSLLFMMLRVTCAETKYFCYMKTHSLAIYICWDYFMSNFCAREIISTCEQCAQSIYTSHTRWEILKPSKTVGREKKGLVTNIKASALCSTHVCRYQSKFIVHSRPHDNSIALHLNCWNFQVAKGCSHRSQRCQREKRMNYIPMLQSRICNFLPPQFGGLRLRIRPYGQIVHTEHLKFVWKLVKSIQYELFPFGQCFRLLLPLKPVWLCIV